jgi:hypothetical protein
MSRRFIVPALVLTVALAGAAIAAQRRDVFVGSRSDPAIQYPTAPTADDVTALVRRIQEGTARLAFDPTSGYLRSVLDELKIPIESQMLVFSQTSFQGPKINIHNPRAIFFSDTASVGWVRGGDILEIAATDPRQGVVFYQLPQEPSDRPAITRNDQCLACHLSWETLAVPGLVLQSVHPLPDEKAYVTGYTTIHGSPLEERWGGWWVTGDHGGARHMGNIPVMPADKGKSPLVDPTSPMRSVEGLFDLKGYPTAYSDVVALLVLAHQTQMTNHITRIGWEARLAAASPGEDASARVREAAADLVNYLLFVDEAPLPGPVKGSSGFAEKFSAAGPRDRQGRSLRDLDLERRLFRYPASYMIYSPAFDALPPAAREAIYERLWHILSARDANPRYQRLSAGDRQAILEILRETKTDLPEYFR